MIDINVKIKGRYKLDIFKSNGELKESTGWFNNMILNQGKDKFATYARALLLSTCQVGLSNITPAATDVSLGSLLASTTTRSTDSNTISVSPRYSSVVYTYTFAAGSAAGNITEVGVGWGTTNSLFSRALILDGDQNPTSITVLSDEILTVTYELRGYIPETDATGVINISGTDYTWTARAANAEALSSWNIGVGVSSGESITSTGNFVAYSGEIGDISSSPAGTTSNSTSVTTDDYVAGDYYVDHNITFGPTAANFSGGIGAVTLSGTSKYQIGFSPYVPKTSLQTLTLKIRHSWS